MKYFAIQAGEPARAEDYYIFGGVVVCGLIAFCVRVALDYAGVAKFEPGFFFRVISYAHNNSVVNAESCH